MSGVGIAKSWLWGAHSALGLAVALATFAIDQMHKFWMLYVYDITAKGKVAVTSFLDLVFVKNTGISYSLFDQDSQAGQYMLAAFAVLASAATSRRRDRSFGSRSTAMDLSRITDASVIGGC